MTAISDSSASLAYALNTETVRPEPTRPDAGDIYAGDDGGITDCWPLPGDDGGITDCWPLPGGDGGIDLPQDPDIELPGGPGGILPDDKEIYVDDNGQLGWRTVVKGTSGDDTINVTLNPDGSADVEVNGETTHYSAEDARDMRVDGGAGDDTITVTDNRLRFPGLGGGDVTVQGGSGDDNIDGDLDAVEADGGTGSDTINGFPELRFPIPGNPLPRDPGGFDPMPMPRDPGNFEPPVYIPL